ERRHRRRIAARQLAREPGIACRDECEGEHPPRVGLFRQRREDGMHRNQDPERDKHAARYIEDRLSMAHRDCLCDCSLPGSALLTILRNHGNRLQPPRTVVTLTLARTMLPVGYSCPRLSACAGMARPDAESSSVVPRMRGLMLHMKEAVSQ